LDIFDNEKSIRKVIAKVGEDSFLELLEVQKADAMGQNPIYLDKRMIMLDNIIKIYNEIKNDNQCLNQREMAINGHDLIQMGMKPGRDMKDMLNYLFECILENPELNDKQKLIDLAKHGIM
jgi:tRNA nucleotidyltransferase (CCA-adding enzyme)